MEYMLGIFMRLFVIRLFVFYFFIIIFNNITMNNQSFYSFSIDGFGYRELNEASKLLAALSDGTSALETADTPDPMDFDNLRIGFNANSGYVFLYSEDGPTWMEDNGKLFEFLTCLECGEELTELDPDGSVDHTPAMIRAGECPRLNQ